MSGLDSSSTPTVNAPAHEATLMKYSADLAAYGLDEIQVSTEHKSLRANDRTLFVRACFSTPPFCLAAFLRSALFGAAAFLVS
jgi:hypothetical protein